MKTLNILLLLYCCSLWGCVSWKKMLVVGSGRNEAIQNAITDFTHTGKFDKKANAYWVYTVDIDSNMIAVGILGSTTKIPVIIKNKTKYIYSAFPTDYCIAKGKIFYWTDSTKIVTQDLIQTFSKAGIVDTVHFGNIQSEPNDDAKKGTHYFFCRKNLRLYKKKSQ